MAGRPVQTAAVKGPVAVLYQSAAAPAVDGLSKPAKPGGYADSGADIACALRQAGAAVIAPVPAPDPARQQDWVFPDDAAGIAAARAAGARVLWANTVLFAGHPLEAVVHETWIVGQWPADVQTFEDKAATNEGLRCAGLPLPSALVVNRDRAEGLGLAELSLARLGEAGLELPLIVKPVRGRGSQGVVRVDCREDGQGVPRLFDLNLKPNLTGPGRPGRDDQESLMGLAARAIGWSYADRLQAMLAQAWRDG
jgi:hypothetical protein